jgi:hypothetical protein
MEKFNEILDKEEFIQSSLLLIEVMFIKLIFILNNINIYIVIRLYLKKIIFKLWKNSKKS